MQPCWEDSRSFFEKLQKAEGLDLRDNRGKRHELALVLVGVTLALLSKRDGCLSSIHRYLVNHQEQLTAFLGVAPKPAISRSQLPRLLEQVAVPHFDRMLLTHFGVELKEREKRWFALDGKELRGSLARGASRGEAVVRAIAHESQHCQSQTYYHGAKESELGTAQQLLETSGLAGQKTSFDALHCQVKTLELITRAKGKYVVGLKENQKELRAQVVQVSQSAPTLWETQSVEKGHGRIETRRYEFYDLLEVEKAAKWQDAQLRTGVKVLREREELKTQKKSREESYYITNEVGHYEEISGAIRNHWQIEVDNHVRDVSLQEDQLRSQKKGVQQVLAGARTLVLEILKKIASPNKKAQLEHFADNFADLLGTLRSLNFL